MNGASSARDIVASVNGVQGETGVYAEAQTRVNMSFPDQAVATSDSVTFKLYGKNTLPQVISGTVEFGITNGRDATFGHSLMRSMVLRVPLALRQSIS